MPDLSFVKELGYLSFATRLKILSDQFIADGESIYKQLGIDFHPRWFMIFYLLHTRGQLSITDIAAQLNYSHPAVIQITRDMLEAELIVSEKDAADARRRLLAISPKGQRLLPRLQKVWRSIEENVTAFFAELDTDMLAVISNVESAMGQRPISTRVVGSYRELFLRDIVLESYSEAFGDSFERLNREWLEEYFSVEAEDEKTLSNPRAILDGGGVIRFAVHGDRAVGTYALAKIEGGTYELTKMAVSRAHRHLGVGRLMLADAESRARQLRVETLVVKTSPQLQAANHLYQEAGFTLAPGWRDEVYQRPTIVYIKTY